MPKIFKTVLFTGLILLPFISMAQEEDIIEDLLQEEVAVENPVYKPVIGFSTGVFNFYGDVRNNLYNPILGDNGYRFNVRTYLDADRYFKLSLNFAYGQTSGNHHSFSNPSENMNFHTDLVIFGANVEYSFNHIFKTSSFVLPYVSLGIENIQFNPKGDLRDADNLDYYYWNDGTIRNINQTSDLNQPTSILNRDFIYETDLRKYEKSLGYGNYNKNTLGIPIEAGICLKISERVNCKLGTSIHFTLSDYIDNVAATGTSIKGNKGNDIITFSYLSLELDLFSEPKTQIIEKYFAELDFDDVMYGDEDGDFILDAADECPGTPYGIAVDTLGCPIDTDQDGIPDYQDEEVFSSPEAWIDENGVTISEEEYLKRLLERDQAMPRDQVKAYFETIGEGYVHKKVTEIPEKFKALDTDEDGEISFDELLKAIDDYFDFKLDFTVEDIYELNRIFFNQ